MTEKELSKYFYLKKEIEDLEERINKLGVGIGSIVLTDMPKGNKKRVSIQEKITELKNKYIEARVSALEEYLKIENYINSVEDTEIRTIMRMRFLDLKTWDEIGKEFYSDRTTISKKLRANIKSLSHNSHK